MGPSEPYINAGVALLDLDKIRDYGVYERWLHDINSRAFSCGDQDVINRACRGNIALVSNEYNSSLSTGFADQPKIMHWAGPADSKPWVNRQARNHHIWQRWANDYAARTEPAAIAVGRLHPDHGSPGHGLSHARR
jgi:lipopolysaccharide biosynthesis glycosyltransferase